MEFEFSVDIFPPHFEIIFNSIQNLNSKTQNSEKAKYLVSYSGSNINIFVFVVHRNYLFQLEHLFVAMRVLVN